MKTFVVLLLAMFSLIFGSCALDIPPEVQEAIEAMERLEEKLAELDTVSAQLDQCISDMELVREAFYLLYAQCMEDP